jgi:hypothetical protein
VICPACRGDEVSVIETRCFDGRLVVRRRGCSCGARWTTEEKVKAGTLTTTGVLPVAGGTPPVAAGSEGRANGPPPKPAESLSGAAQHGDSSASGDLRGSGFLPGLPGPDLSKPKIGKSNSARALEGFDEFWAAYPRKVKKPPAQRAWMRQRPPLAAVLAALAWHTKSDAWTKDGGEYIPHPATWLNARQWEDERQAPNGHRGRWAAPHPGEFEYPVGEQKL